VSWAAAGRCLTGVDVLLAMSVSEAKNPHCHRVASGCSRSCPVPPVTEPPSSAMAGPGKASNGTAAARTAVLGVPSSWTLGIEVNRLRCRSRASTWRCLPAGCAIPHASGMFVPIPSCQNSKQGTGPPPDTPCRRTGPASRARGGGELPRRGPGATARPPLRAG